MSRQYEMRELSFSAAPPTGSHVAVELNVELKSDGDAQLVRGFYAGDGVYKARFEPKTAGSYHYRTSGIINEEGDMAVEPAASGSHGRVLAEGLHFVHEDGTPYYPFGTTVYALAHQTPELINQTLATLSKSPFNKVRMCVFPKHYQYNKNDPEHFAFEKDANGGWDVDHPCFAFWDAFEDVLRRLNDMGIEADIILFHPYDRWGLSTLPQRDNLVYLDYLTRRLSAFPNVWWSLANEYDLCPAKSIADWEEIERFVYDHDPYRHLLSNHNCFKEWDYSRPAVSHVSKQTKVLYRVPQLFTTYNKPVIIDECCYEGNLPDVWGSISGREMTARFWRVVASGGYCTHGETFFDPDSNPDEEVVWWSKGGRLIGESPARIAFLKDIIYGLPAPLEPEKHRYDEMINVTDDEAESFLATIPEAHRPFVRSMLRMTPTERLEFQASQPHWSSHAGDEVFLHYYDIQTSSVVNLTLPETRRYRVEIIDTWDMTRSTAAEGVSGTVRIKMPGREGIAVLATAVE